MGVFEVRCFEMTRRRRGILVVAFGDIEVEAAMFCVSNINLVAIINCQTKYKRIHSLRISKKIVPSKNFVLSREGKKPPSQKTKGLL